MITKNQIRIGKDEIHVFRVTPWGETMGVKFKTSDMEMVKIGKKDDQGSDAVIITTDYDETKIGEGLSPDALWWLKNCILKVLSA